MIPQETLLGLAEKWEPEASNSSQGYRQATCCSCGGYMIAMWHCWLKIGGFKKELHLCSKCGIKYGHKKVDTLVVIPTNNGRGQLINCLQSISNLYPILIVDTGSDEFYADEVKKQFSQLDITITKTPYKGYAPGAYLWAYWNFPANSYLFMQDSVVVLEKDYVKPFREKDANGLVAWTLFPILWDSIPQKHWCQYQFNVEPQFGIFGPIFFVKREVLNKLEAMKMLPNIPFTREQAQGCERAWMMAIMKANLPVEAVEPLWDFERMVNGTFSVFRKVWNKRE